MTRYASGVVLAFFGLGTSCGGKTSSTATGSNPGTNAGTVPADSAAAEPIACSPIKIDDMEESFGPPGGGAFIWSKGIGNWFYDKGKDAVSEDIVPPRGDSKKARHLDGLSGTGLLCQLNHPLNAPVDLSSYSGVTFWARLASPGGQLVVTIKGQDTAAGTEPFTQDAIVTDTWQAVDLPFAGFRQATSSSPLAANAVADFDFTIVGVGAFDLWIDDLALVCPPHP